MSKGKNLLKKSKSPAPWKLLKSWRNIGEKAFKKCPKMTKTGFFTFFVGFKNSPKNIFLSFSTKINVDKLTQRTEKMGKLIIFEEIMTVQSCKNFEKTFSTLMSLTSSKMKIFELFKKQKPKFKYVSTNWF
jgi:hypothetical protein